jgi:hypothetical protein
MATKVDLSDLEITSTLGKQLEIAGKIGRTEARIGFIQARLQFLLDENESELQSNFDDYVDHSLRRALEWCKEIAEDLKDTY